MVTLPFTVAHSVHLFKNTVQCTLYLSHLSTFLTFFFSQVFDLTKGGPQPAIELFRKVPHVKLLACGGDGTVGWLLSVLDKVAVDPPPAVSVLPLGTGNDLSRSLGE